MSRIIISAIVLCTVSFLVGRLTAPEPFLETLDETSFYESEFSGDFNEFWEQEMKFYDSLKQEIEK